MNQSCYNQGGVQLRFLVNTKKGCMHVYPWIFILLFLILPVFITPANSQSKEILKYYDNEKTLLKERYFIKSGKKPLIHGLYESFFSDGSIQTRGYYKNNVPDSLWMYFYEKGGIKMSGNLREGKNFGLWQFFFENGNLNMKGNIFGDRKNGDWIFYYENKQLKAEGAYKDNLKTGPWIYYNEDGSIKARAIYKEDVGIYNEYYNSGKLKATGLNAFGKSDSTWIYYYENAAKKAVGNYENGLKTGKWVFYHENGNMASEGEYVEGKKDGKWIYYHENGEMSSEGALQKGKKEGYWKIFNTSGRFMADGVFVKGEGEYHEYYESGKLKIDGFVKDGKNVGQWYYYYEDGSLEGECFFKDGEGEYIGYYQDGKPYMKGTIRNGKNTGLWEFYKPDGEIAGYYRPLYDGDQPSYKLAEKTASQQGEGVSRDYLKPDYKYKKRKIRYFEPQINEFQGKIISTNPLGAFVGKVPLSFEYYFQERLGYEMQIQYLRNPFFKKDENVALNDTYSRGFDASIRQKFYSEEKKLGMFYFAHEIRFTSLIHKSNVIDSLSIPDSNLNLEIDANENRFEYGILFGNRWMKYNREKYIKDSKKGGITIDFNLGVGIGYRSFNKNFPETLVYDQIFNDLNQRKFSITPRVGIYIGYIF